MTEQITHNKFKTYIALTKPGIIRGNIITALAGFLLASDGHVNLSQLCYCLIGISLVIASGCVFNNYIDREIDKKMARTSKRALVSGEISNKNALIFASILGIAGFLIIALRLNLPTLYTGLTGFIFYVVIYSYYKRRSTHGTLIGGVSGATALLAGYVAVTNRFDAASLILFLIMLFWQMPHFYAIAIYSLKDYKAAGVPVHPAVYGIHSTKLSMLVYTGLFVISTVLLAAFGYTGLTYLVIMTLLGAIWLRMAVDGLKTKNDDKWARQMFGFSLLMLLTFSLLIGLNFILP